MKKGKEEEEKEAEEEARWVMVTPTENGTPLSRRRNVAEGWRRLTPQIRPRLDLHRLQDPTLR